MGITATDGIVTLIIFYKEHMKISTSWDIFKKCSRSLISKEERLVVPYYDGGFQNIF